MRESLFWRALPYCAQRVSERRYILLNRDYKPLGCPNVWTNYEDHPSVLIFFRALSARQAAAIDVKGRRSLECVWLYNDGCVPMSSAAHWADYCARLYRLATLTIKS